MFEDMLVETKFACSLRINHFQVKCLTAESAHCLLRTNANFLHSYFSVFICQHTLVPNYLGTNLLAICDIHSLR